jgi:hypothetical protein
MLPSIPSCKFVTQGMERLLCDALQPLLHPPIEQPPPLLFSQCSPIKRRAKACPPSTRVIVRKDSGGQKLRFQKPHPSRRLRACDSTFRGPFASAASETKTGRIPVPSPDGGRGAAACAGATVPRRPPEEVSNPRPSQCGLCAHRVRPALRAVMPPRQQRSPFREPVQRPARTRHPAPATFPERRSHVVKPVRDQ